MGAERTQKGAVGQQLAASGRARRAEAIRRKGGGEGGPNIGRDISRGVMEDQMLRNDKEGKQKQGKPGRPGKPIDGRPPFPPLKGGPVEPPMKSPVEGRPPFPPKEGRPVEPPMDGRPPIDGDVRIQPFPYPGRGEDQFGPDGPERTLPYLPEQPPGGGRPGKPPFFEGPLPGPRPDMPYRPPVEKPPWGREDDPNYGREKDAWHQRRKEMEMKRKEDMWRKAKERRGGTDLGPGRGDRIPDEAFAQDKFDALRQQGGQNLERPGAAATTLQDFLAQMANLRGGGIR
jgi:hypothetical protein